MLVQIVKNTIDKKEQKKFFNHLKDAESSEESNGVVKIKKKYCFHIENMFVFEGPIVFHVLITLGRKSDYVIKFGRARKRKKFNFRFFVTVTTT